MFVRDIEHLMLCLSGVNIFGSNAVFAFFLVGLSILNLNNLNHTTNTVFITLSSFCSRPVNLFHSTANGPALVLPDYASA